MAPTDVIMDIDMDPVMGMVDITLVDIRVPVIIIDIQFTHLEEGTTTIYTTPTDQALTSTFLVII